MNRRCRTPLAVLALLLALSLPAAAAAAVCGDGIVDEAVGEMCDDGVNTGAYRQCNPECTYAPPGWCGNGVVEEDRDETCDDGVNDGAYGLVDGVPRGCTGLCQMGPYCGDGMVNSDRGEECDLGENTGEYGGCFPDCVRAPYCGDGIVQSPPEDCDSGPTDDDVCHQCHYMLD